jgi:hypothetical protein
VTPILDPGRSTSTRVHLPKLTIGRQVSMASSTPTRGGGSSRGGPPEELEHAVRVPQSSSVGKYQNLEVGISAGDIGPVMALESPVRSQAIRAQGLSLNLFLTNQSVEDSSIDVPSSYMCVSPAGRVGGICPAKPD